jgi:hypothetical protein
MSRQWLGQFLFVSVWMPVIYISLLLQRIFKDKRGRSPKWLVEATSIIFNTLWVSYDRFFKGLFGDGERTMGPDEQWKHPARVGVEGRIKPALLMKLEILTWIYEQALYNLTLQTPAELAVS